MQEDAAQHASLSSSPLAQWSRRSVKILITPSLPLFFLFCRMTRIIGIFGYFRRDSHYDLSPSIEFAQQATSRVLPSLGICFLYLRHKLWFARCAVMLNFYRICCDGKVEKLKVPSYKTQVTRALPRFSISENNKIKFISKFRFIAVKRSLFNCFSLVYLTVLPGSRKIKTPLGSTRRSAIKNCKAQLSCAMWKAMKNSKFFSWLNCVYCHL